MRIGFMDKPEDVTWLLETHLRGVTLPTMWQGFQSYVLQGNEDAPYAVNLYLSQSPFYLDDFLRVTFDHPAPTYCEYAAYNGRTNHRKGIACQRA